MNVEIPQIAFTRHERSWASHLYVYAVVARRSGGLSIGVNLNPDRACNFDCIYCEVDRSTPPAVRKVDLDVLRRELDVLLTAHRDGSLYEDEPYSHLPPHRHVVRDIAFSGDGEPTTCPLFEQAIRIAADARHAHGLHDTKLVLITDACYLTREPVRAGLSLLDDNNGEIWAKLDAGTEPYYQLVNRPNVPLRQVLDNILDAARTRPVVIQSLFMRVHGQPPPRAEIEAYCDRLNELIAAGARLKLLQLYTIARRTPEPYATLLSNAELDAIAEIVRARVHVPAETYYGVAV